MGLLVVQKAYFWGREVDLSPENGAKQRSSKQNNFIARSQDSLTSEIMLD